LLASKLTPDLCLDANNKKLGSRGSRLLMNKVSGTIEEEDAEEEQVPEVIELTEAELDKDLPARFLEPKNPYAPRVLMNYSYIQNKFLKNEMVDQLVMHFETDGQTIMKDSEEAKIQEEITESRRIALKDTVNKHDLMDHNHEFDVKQARAIMRNKFNYSVRQTQTPVGYLKELCVYTKRLQLKNFSETVNLSWIYDLYIQKWDSNT
jgi:hypothetical protein